MKENYDKKMTELLNECEKKGMKLIIVDDRLGWNELASRGEQEYKRGGKGLCGSLR